MTVYEEIREERRRQRHGEGFGDEHDDRHTDGSLAQAAACYAAGIVESPPWPSSWDLTWDKREKHSRRRQLVIAAALCVAEVQRLDRASSEQESGSQSWAELEVEADLSRPEPMRLAVGGWHIVELYGHRRLAGQVSQASFPEGFVQINTVQGPTRIYNPKAVFSLAPVTEQAARAAAVKCCDEPAPIKPWESGEQQRIEALRAALSKVARGNVSPAVDLAREALAADAALASTDEPPDSEPLDDEDCPICLP